MKTVDEIMHEVRELYVERQNARDALKVLHTDIKNKVKRVKKAGTRLVFNESTNECERRAAKHYVLFEAKEGGWVFGISTDDHPADPPNEQDGDRIFRLLISFQSIAGELIKNESKLKEILGIG